MTRYISAEKKDHDDFMVPFTKEEGEIVYDGRTSFGPWATMSQQSFDKWGVGLGQGSGQKYRRDSDGQLIKVEG